MFLAFVALPAHASATVSLQNPSTVVLDTFPIFENQVNVRQAHISWLASKEEAGMQATITYIASINGSTPTLLKLYGTFRQFQLKVSTADSHESLDVILQDFRGITRSFHDETSVQMKASNGTFGDLRESMQSTVAASARVRSFEDTYWQTRETTELADFDLRVDHAEEMLATLRGNGYEITAAQEKLTEITSMRNELTTAFQTRDNSGIEQAHKKIHTASIGFAQTVRGLRVTESPDTNLRQDIEQGRAIMTRAGMVNADLKSRGVITGSIEQYVSAGTTQLTAAAAQSDNGNTESAKATLRQFRTTVQSLRDSYRSTLVKEDLPQTTAQGVLSVAQALDITAARMLSR